MQSGHRIIRLKATNVKRLVAVDIAPADSQSVVEVTGKNGAGKSSVLDAIAFAIGGEALIPPEARRTGQRRAAIEVDIGEYRVKRLWPETGGPSRLEVYDKAGTKLRSPQAIMDSLAGSLAIDPSRFCAMPPREQRATLLRLVGLEERLVADRAAREAANARIRAAKVRYDNAMERRRVAALKIPPADPASPNLSLPELTAELQRRYDADRARLSAIGNLNAAKASLADKQKKAAATLKEIADLEAQLAALREKATKQEAYIRSEVALITQAEAEVAAMPVQDIESIKKAIDVYAANEKIVEARTIVATATKDIEEADRDIVTDREKLKAIEDAQRQAIEEAQFPVAGLGFAEDGVTYNGLPFEQASQAERLRVSIAMAMALSPTLRVILVRDGALFDAASMQIIEQMARERGYQVWVETVDSDSPGAVVIEDGCVRDADTSQPARLFTPPSAPPPPAASTSPATSDEGWVD